MARSEATRDSRERTSRECLSTRGVSGQVVDELLAYDTPLITSDAPHGDLAVLPDEPHLEAWREYAAEARGKGAIAALSSRFPQLLFPIRDGISRSDSYRRATRQGIWPDGDREACGLALASPESITLEIGSTLAGAIPLLVVPERADFEDLVRAFSARNEPVDVPSSMGACLVTGLNNWDRIRAYRQSWEIAHPSESWSEEFRRILPRKQLYEDRVILLSTGPYSGIPAADAGFSGERWRDLSLAIRREHECSHYFTLRIVGTMRSNIADEIVADYVGLVRTFDHYRGDLALLFMGLEGYPAYRNGARLQNYRGDPRLSEPAFAVVRELAYEALQNLARFDAACPKNRREGRELARLVVAFLSLRLEELARVDLIERLLSDAAGRVEQVADQPAWDKRSALQISCDRSGLEEAMASLSRFADETLSKKASADLHVVLDEILSNIVRSAREGQENLEPIDVEIRQRGNVVEIEVVDSAVEFNPLARPDPDLSQPLGDKPIGGLGVYLTRRLTDEQFYERRKGRNRLVVRKRI